MIHAIFSILPNILKLIEALVFFLTHNSFARPHIQIDINEIKRAFKKFLHLI